MNLIKHNKVDLPLIMEGSQDEKFYKNNEDYTIIKDNYKTSLLFYIKIIQNNNKFES